MSNPITNYANVSVVGSTDILWLWQSGAQQSCTALQMKTYLLGGGSAAIASGKTATISNTLTFTGTDSSTVSFGAGGTVLYSSGIGSTVQAYSARLASVAGLSSPGTSGYILSSTTGGTLSWIPPNLIATASGTNTYTATPSPALSAYNTGQAVFIKFTNANTGGASLNLNGLGAIAIQQNSAAVISGQIPAGSTLLLIFDGTNFQIIGNEAVAYTLPQATASVLGGVIVDNTTITATAGVISAAKSVHVLSGTLAAGTATVTVPAGVAPWVQSTNTASLTNSGALAVSVTSATATVTSSNALDTSTFNLLYWA